MHALGIDATAGAPGRRLDWQTLSTQLPAPLRRAQRNVHKGSFGTLGIVGGSEGMVGAAILAARAALHLGAGKIWVGLAASEPPRGGLGAARVDAQACARGARSRSRPRSSPARAWAPMRARANCSRARWRYRSPLVLDADALNLIATDQELARQVATRTQATAITPHPAEAARLLATTTAAVQDDRLAAALALAKQLRCRGGAQGRGQRAGASTTAGGRSTAAAIPALASGGTGDVLAGMLGAFLAQGIALRQALEFAVCLHGAAADTLVAAGEGPVGLSASEIAPAARRLLNAAARVASRE